jgi:hypothetical protein
MIGRATLLKYNGKISKQEFDKYTYIITKLNNHLTNIVEETYQLHQQRLSDSLQTHYPPNSIDLQNANMDLLSFGFLIFNQPPHWGDEYKIFEISIHCSREIFTLPQYFQRLETHDPRHGCRRLDCGTGRPISLTKGFCYFCPIKSKNKIL